MFLRRLTIENIRALADLDLDLSDGEGTRKWTFLLGENGVGKSTVLRAAALVLAGSDALPELLGDVDGWVRDGAKVGRVTATLATQAGDRHEIALSLERGATLGQIMGANAEALDRLDDALRHTARNYAVFGYGVSRRLGQDSHSLSSSPYRALRARPVATLFSPEASLNPLETWAVDLHYRKGESGLDIVRATLDAFLRGVRFEDIDRSTSPPRLLFATPDGVVPLARLSDGYQNVAAWCGDLLYRISTIFDDYKDPLAVRGLLLLDEIGLHLHPVWQRELISFLSERLPNMQIIATTHSPLTVHQAGEREVVVLRRDGARVTAQTYEGAPRRLFLHQLLTSPLFGLDTLDSKVVEDQRAELEGLRGIAAPTASQTRRMTVVREELAERPAYGPATAQGDQSVALLEKIAAELERREP